MSPASHPLSQISLNSLLNPAFLFPTPEWLHETPFLSLYLVFLQASHWDHSPCRHHLGSWDCC